MTRKKPDRRPTARSKAREEVLQARRDLKAAKNELRLLREAAGRALQLAERRCLAAQRRSRSWKELAKRYRDPFRILKLSASFGALLWRYGSTVICSDCQLFCIVWLDGAWRCGGPDCGTIYIPYPPK